MLNDNVGKKIVEALKMQNEGTSFDTQDDFGTSNDVYTSGMESVLTDDAKPEVSESSPKEIYQNQFNSSSQMSIDSAFAQSVAQNLGENYYQEITQNIEFPTNVSILNNLIAKLPVGVSKQTGALIIKQTMEALGIPMSSVLQEAKQVQDSLSANALECQKNIIEYKKQIGLLEQKAQQLQKQAVAMNDIISLFANTH